MWLLVNPYCKGFSGAAGCGDALGSPSPPLLGAPRLIPNRFYAPSDGSCFVVFSVLGHCSALRPLSTNAVEPQ